MAHFWSVFPNFAAKIFFPENLALSQTASFGFLVPCQNSEKKINIQFQEDAWSEGQTEGWKNGRTNRLYFIGPFQLLPEVQISCVKFKELNTSHLFTFRTMKTTV